MYVKRTYDESDSQKHEVRLIMQLRSLGLLLLQLRTHAGRKRPLQTVHGGCSSKKTAIRVGPQLRASLPGHASSTACTGFAVPAGGATQEICLRESG